MPENEKQTNKERLKDITDSIEEVSKNSFSRTSMPNISAQ